MAKGAKIRPEQLTRAKRLLQNLPEKDDSKTRPEAARLLEKDFKKAFQKGYSPKEIAALLKNAGILIPAYLLKNFLIDKRKDSRESIPESNVEKPSAKAQQITITPDTSDEEL